MLLTKSDKNMNSLFLLGYMLHTLVFDFKLHFEKNINLHGFLFCSKMHPKYVAVVHLHENINHEPTLLDFVHLKICSLREMQTPTYLMFQNLQLQ